VPPAVTGQQVSPPRIPSRGCAGDRARVQASVESAPPPASVAVRWRDAAGRTGTVPLAAAGGTSWAGTLGPFTEPGTVTWSVTATAEAGSATGPELTLTVYRCADPPITSAISPDR
ncbi:MAG TPA: hypothetical protein VD813_02820, partial [Pseudonocardia sp.]|nr:hypothetical protein [Pseudonocardia sp.]